MVPPRNNVGIELMEQGNEVIAPAGNESNGQNNVVPVNVLENAGPSNQSNEAPMGKMSHT